MQNFVPPASLFLDVFFGLEWLLQTIRKKKICFAYLQICSFDIANSFLSASRSLFFDALQFPIADGLVLFLYNVSVDPTVSTNSFKLLSLDKHFL